MLALLAGLCIAPTLTAGNQLVGDVAPRGAETEAYTWPITALVVGLGDRQLRSAGAIVEASDWQAAFLVARRRRGAERGCSRRRALADAAAAARATKPSC